MSESVLLISWETVLVGEIEIELSLPFADAFEFDSGTELGAGWFGNFELELDSGRWWDSEGKLNARWIW